MADKMDLLRKLDAYAFAAYEWNLYLDTHPEDTDAIAMFHKMAGRARELKEEYENNFGPITAEGSQNMDFWDWISDPWPWDK